MDRLVHRGPDDCGRLPRQPCRAGVPPAVDHRPGRRPSAALERGRHRLDGLQRRDLQLPLAAATAGGQGAHAPLPGRHRGPRPPLRGRGDADVPPLARDVRPGDLGRAPPHAGPGPRPDGPEAPGLSHHGGRLTFASELKALLALPEADVPRRIDPRGAGPLPVLRLRPAPADHPGGDEQAAAGALCRLARRRAGDRAVLGTRLERRARAARRGGHRGAARDPRRCRARADDRRRAAGCVPLGGHRLDDHRRPDAAALQPAGEDVRDRLPRPEVRRDALRRARRAAPGDRAPYVPRRAQGVGDPAGIWPGSSTSRSPTARPCRRGTSRARPGVGDRRPDRRCRRRALRRLRPLPGARPDRAVPPPPDRPAPGPGRDHGPRPAAFGPVEDPAPQTPAALREHQRAGRRATSAG